MKKAAFHGYRIYRQEALPDTYNRVLAEQLKHCLTLCKRYPENPDLATHEIRKSTKRIRALYRLFHTAIGHDQYVEGKKVYGNLSRLLAEHRVGAVHIEVLNVLSLNKRIPLNHSLLADLVTNLSEVHKHLTNKLLQADDIQNSVQKIIVAERQKLFSEPLLKCDFNNLFSGLHRSYGQGRKDLQMVIHQSGSENLHNLRKRVKSIWNQLILLQPIWPALMNVTIHQFDLLAEKLGMEHDLAELEQYLIKDQFAASSNDFANLSGVINKKRQQIQKHIIPAAARLFADKPDVMARRLKHYYKVFMK